MFLLISIQDCFRHAIIDRYRVNSRFDWRCSNQRDKRKPLFKPMTNGVCHNRTVRKF